MSIAELRHAYHRRICSCILSAPFGIPNIADISSKASKAIAQGIVERINCPLTRRLLRTEALNLIRNRKGHIPHVVAVTAEALPTRLASLALGTGDLDCVYHFALTELRQAVEALGSEDQWDMLMAMIEGRRLRDISDLPLDLAT